MPRVRWSRWLAGLMLLLLPIGMSLSVGGDDVPGRRIASHLPMQETPAEEPRHSEAKPRMRTLLQAPTPFSALPSWALIDSIPIALPPRWWPSDFACQPPRQRPRQQQRSRAPPVPHHPA